VEDLAEKLKQALSDPNRLESLRSAASERLCSEYNWDRITGQYLKVDGEALNGHNGRPAPK